MNAESRVQAPWSLEAAAVAQALEVDPNTGLGATEVARRRKRFGPNLLQKQHRRPLLGILLAQFRSVVVVLIVSGEL